MRNPLPSLAVAAALAIGTAPAGAAIVTASFAGTVGSHDGSLLIQTDVPAGTPVSFEVRFDDDFTAMSASTLAATVLDPWAGGWLQVGANRYALDSREWWGLRVDTATDEWLTTHMRFGGSGPNSGGGAEFYYLWLVFAPDLSLADTVDVGFAYPSGGIGYAASTGTYRVERADVPLPATAWLVLPGLAMLGWRARKGGPARSA